METAIGCLLQALAEVAQLVAEAITERYPRTWWKVLGAVVVLVLAVVVVWALNWWKSLGIAALLALLGGGVYHLVRRRFWPDPEIAVTAPSPAAAHDPVLMAYPVDGVCTFTVKGETQNARVGVHTVVIFVRRWKGDWWPQNLDHPARIFSDGRWEAGAQISVEPQARGTDFWILALLMHKEQVPSIGQSYANVPSSLAASDMVHCRVQ